MQKMRSLRRLLDGNANAASSMKAAYAIHIENCFLTRAEDLKRNRALMSTPSHASAATRQ